jgi:adenylate kinase family enzyme
MKKVLVIGSCGAGKSAFTRRLTEILRLELIHLDKFYWRPGWIEPPKDEWREIVAGLVRRDSWIIDGNYSGTLEMRLAVCDMVILLDMPRLVCLWRVLKRIILYREGNRPDMAAGCHERFDLKFLKYVWNFPRHSLPKVKEKLRLHCQNKTVVVLKSQRDIESFLANPTETGRFRFTESTQLQAI